MKTKTAAVIASAGLLFSASLSAQQPEVRGWYAAVAAGGTWIEVNDNILAITGSTASSLSKEENSSVWGLALGYDLSRHWAIEGGYADIGKFEQRRTSTAGVVGSLGARSEGSGWFLNGVGKLPLNNQFYLLGKLGFAYTTLKTDLDATGGVVLGTNPNRKKSESNLLWGLGAGYDFTPTLGVRFDYTQMDNVGDSQTGEGDIGTWTIGLKFRF